MAAGGEAGAGGLTGRAWSLDEPVDEVDDGEEDGEELGCDVVCPVRCVSASFREPIPHPINRKRSISAATSPRPRPKLLLSLRRMLRVRSKLRSGSILLST